MVVVVVALAVVVAMTMAIKKMPFAATTKQMTMLRSTKQPASMTTMMLLWEEILRHFEKRGKKLAPPVCR